MSTADYRRDQPRPPLNPPELHPMSDTTLPAWIPVCATAAIAPADVFRFDHAGQTYAIYRTDDNQYFATAGLCTHAKVHLASGFVSGRIIECPKHNGRFDFTTGKAQGAPVCVDLRTYPVKIADNQVFIQLV